MKNYTVEKRATTRELITFTEFNRKGEKIAVEFTKGTNDGSKHSLPVMWYKNGFIDRVLPTYWNVDVYATEDGGNGICHNKYDPTGKPSEDGKRQVINFDFMLEATDANKELLLNEIVKRAYM